MILIFLILFILFALLLLLGVVFYNRLIRWKNMVAEGWSGIDIQLKRRADLIPNLVSIVKGYVQHEKNLFEKVTELRSQSLHCKEVKDRENIENQLSSALNQILVIAENYPDLKAAANFKSLQNSITEVEENIQLSRRYYNGAVRTLNILVESFPSNIIAQKFQFKQAAYFQLSSPSEKLSPEISFRKE